MRPAKLPDHRPETLDLAVAMLDCHRHIAHETMEKCCIGRQILEIDLHI
jgi:hypothetical protein